MSWGSPSKQSHKAPVSHVMRRPSGLAIQVVAPLFRCSTVDSAVRDAFRDPPTRRAMNRANALGADYRSIAVVGKETWRLMVMDFSIRDGAGPGLMAPLCSSSTLAVLKRG